MFFQNIFVLSLRDVSLFPFFVRTSPLLPLWKFQFNFRLHNHPYPLSEIMDTPIHTYPIVLDFLRKILIVKRSEWLWVNNSSVLKSQCLHQSVYSLSDSGLIKNYLLSQHIQYMTSRRPYWDPKNNETVAMLVSQTSSVGVELFSYANAFFCFNKFAKMLATTRVKTLSRPGNGIFDLSTSLQM